MLGPPHEPLGEPAADRGAGDREGRRRAPPRRARRRRSRAGVRPTAPRSRRRPTGGDGAFELRRLDRRTLPGERARRGPRPGRLRGVPAGTRDAVRRARRRLAPARLRARRGERRGRRAVHRPRPRPENAALPAHRGGAGRSWTRRAATRSTTSGRARRRSSCPRPDTRRRASCRWSSIPRPRRPPTRPSSAAAGSTGVVVDARRARRSPGRASPSRVRSWTPPRRSRCSPRR